MEKTVTIEGIDLTIDFDHYPASRGRRENGIPIEPDEDEEIIINTVHHSGDDITEIISCCCLDDIEKALWEAMESDAAERLVDPKERLMMGY